MSDIPSSESLGFLKAGAGILTGVGQFLGGREEKQAGEFNAQILEQEASAQRQSQKLLEQQKRKRFKATIATQIATAGAQGFKFTGDPITILTDSVANAEMDIAIDRYNSEVQARASLNKAIIERQEAGRRARGQFLQAGTTLLNTAADLAIERQTLGE